MTITYDSISKRVVINFRGRITVLPDIYGTEADGLAAAEAFCRMKGWQPKARNDEADNVRSPW